MHCALCNGDTTKQTGDHQFKSKVLGQILVPNITFERCSECGNKTFSPEESAALVSYVQKKERDAIEKLPVAGWISASEAADVLGISKQAFSKNPKIKRGFIYSVKIGDRKFYYKKSVQRFKDTNDGRLQLAMSWGQLTPIHGRKRKKKVLGAWSNTISNNLILPNTHHRSDLNNENRYPASA